MAAAEIIAAAAATRPIAPSHAAVVVQHEAAEEPHVAVTNPRLAAAVVRIPRQPALAQPVLLWRVPVHHTQLLDAAAPNPMHRLRAAAADNMPAAAAAMPAVAADTRAADTISRDLPN